MMKIRKLSIARILSLLIAIVFLSIETGYSASCLRVPVGTGRDRAEELIRVIHPVETHSAEREKMNKTFQDLLNILQQEDSIKEELPSVFLILGSPNFRTYIEMAKKWLEYRNKGIEIPIVLAGGIGRGTISLMSKTIAYYKAQNNLSAEEESWLNESIRFIAKHGDNYKGAIREASDRKMSLFETDVLKFIFIKEGIDSNMLHAEGKPSTRTIENFQYTKQIIKGVTEKTNRPIVCVVSSPQLLNRLKFTAYDEDAWLKIIKEKKWLITRFRAYDIKTVELLDRELIELVGYTIGYPEKYTKKYPSLNKGNEVTGILQTSSRVNMPISEKEQLELNKLLNKTKTAFEEYLESLDKLAGVAYDRERNTLSIQASNAMGPDIDTVELRKSL